MFFTILIFCYIGRALTWSIHVPTSIFWQKNDTTCKSAKLLSDWNYSSKYCHNLKVIKQKIKVGVRYAWDKLDMMTPLGNIFFAAKATEQGQQPHFV